MKRSAKKPKRPSKTDLINLTQLKFLVEKGFTDGEICSFFGISHTTFWRMKIAQPKLCDTISDWKKHADERVERCLYEKACGFEHESEEIFQYAGKVIRAKVIKKYPPSEVACIFWLKNRQPDRWRDVPIEQSSKELDGAELTFTGVPSKNGKPEERYSRYLN